MFQKVSPVLPTINILLTNAFYREKLHFTVSYSANYLVVTKENIQLFFFEQKDKSAFRICSCYIFVSNIEDLYAVYSSMNMIQPGGRMIEKPGRLKEFYVVDNNDHQLKFLQQM